MLINFVFIMLISGVFSFFAPQKRIVGIWTILLALSFVYGVLALTGKSVSSDISIIWNAMPNFSISINLNPLRAAKTAALGVVVLSILAFYYNLLSSDDSHTNNMNGLVSINCVLVLIALCSSNYLQLLAAVGMADVIVYSTINHYEGKRKYIYANFFADFLLLNILAIILGQHGNINIMRLEDYSSSWHHRDYIVIMLLICAFTKSGMAMFHTAYQKISLLTPNRINFIMFVATPLMGIIILNTLHGLLNISQYSYILLRIFAVMTILWGFLSVLIVGDPKRKLTYMGMIFWGLSFGGFAWLPVFSQTSFFTFLTAAFLFNSWLALVHTDNKKASHWKQVYNFHMLPTILIVLLYMLSWWKLSSANIILAIAGEFCLGFTTAILMADKFDYTFANNKLSFKSNLLNALPVLVIFAIYAHNNREIIDLWPYEIAIFVLWSTVFLLNPLHKLKPLLQSALVQESDYITLLYNTLFFAPISIIGRALRLLVDIVFLERTVISSIKNAIRFMIFVFRRLHANSVLSSTIFTLLGIFIITFAYYNGVTK